MSQQQSILDAFKSKTYDESRPMSREFIANVFSYMFAALAISGVIAWAVGTNEKLFSDIFFNVNALGQPTGISVIGWVIMFAPFIVMLISIYGMHKLSFGALLAIFLLFAMLMGLSLSSIFMVYKLGSIFKIFLISAGMYGGMAVLGFTTKTDLTKMGSILYMVLIGMIIMGFVNFFTKSPALDYWLAMAGVIVFAGLTAYKMQQIKYASQEVEFGDATTSKLAIMSGLSLYITFINLFMSLLRLFGERK